MIKTRNFFTIVQQGTQSLRLTLGKNPTVLKPGINLCIPIIQTVKNVDMREQSIPILDLQCFTSDNVPVIMQGSLFFQVNNSKDALFNVYNYMENIHSIGTSSMRSIIGTLEYDYINGDRNEINKKLQEIIGNSIKDWGINCTRFEIQQFSPSNPEIRRALEKQMEAERSRREQLLNTEASVNIADGSKRTIILKSEGDLQAQKNKAEGDYIKIVKESEAHKEALRLESEGLAIQLDKISSVLNNDSLLATKLLMELKRIDQFSKIASGNNNTIYFAKDGNLDKGYLTDFLNKTKKNE